MTSPSKRAVVLCSGGLDSTTILAIAKSEGYECHTLAFDYALNTESLEDTKSPRMYKSTFAFRAGGSYDFSSGLSLRLGGGFGFSPVQNGYITPETPDNDRWYGTAGIGYIFGDHFSMDATFYYTQMTRTGHNMETGLSGTFETIAIAGGLGLIYKW